MNEPCTKSRVRVGLISLGCAKNLVDAEIMLGSLIKSGMEITNDAAEADVVIVNTCSFIDEAQEESIDTILQSDQVRAANNRGQGLVVAGCLPQRFRSELPKLLPEVDAFMGIDQVTEIASIVEKALSHRAERQGQLAAPRPNRRQKQSAINKRLAELEEQRTPDHMPPADGAPQPDAGVQAPSADDTSLVNVTDRPLFIPDFATPRFRLTPKHFAYVKIAEGCNHPCSFCIIPRMRGSHRSRSQSDVVAEARQLIRDGVKELNLISQDSTYYGLDLAPARPRSIASPERFAAASRALPAQATTLCTLLRELNDLPGEFWIRLLYTHPAHWTDELIATIAACPKVARYIDIPLQHIHDNMLERMRRETSRAYIEDLIQRIRAGIPGITIRTTFIIGFPGETDGYFASLVDAIKAIRFERLGVFTYSQEEGTRAGRMVDQIPEAVKRERREQLMAAQQPIARDISRSRVGRVIPVLLERPATEVQLREARVSSWEHRLLQGKRPTAPTWRGRHYIARGEADAPDIDGRVFVRGNALAVGEFASVRVVSCNDYDLLAEPV